MCLFLCEKIQIMKCDPRISQCGGQQSRFMCSMGTYSSFRGTGPVPVPVVLTWLLIVLPSVLISIPVQISCFNSL